MSTSTALRFTPTKTQNTTAPTVVIDFTACPMVMEELALVPEAERKGPLIVNPITGFPYRQDKFDEVWREAADAAGIAKAVWN